MTHQQKEQITALRSQGYGYATIAKAIGLKKDTVVAFCRKVGLTGTKAADNSRIELDAGFCPQCGALLTQTPGRKRVKFCSDNCRTAWWNAHPEKVNRKAVYHFTCAHCGKPFTAYGNTKKENTALTPAILQTATKAVTGMSEDKFRSEMSYLAALSIAKNLREKGLLSEEEYAVIDTNLRAEFSPSLGTLLSENDLI